MLLPIVGAMPRLGSLISQLGPLISRLITPRRRQQAYAGDSTTGIKHRTDLMEASDAASGSVWVQRSPSTQKCQEFQAASRRYYWSGLRIVGTRGHTVCGAASAGVAAGAARDEKPRQHDQVIVDIKVRASFLSSTVLPPLVLEGLLKDQDEGILLR